jgi:hypothetical protein
VETLKMKPNFVAYAEKTLQGNCDQAIIRSNKRLRPWHQHLGPEQLEPAQKPQAQGEIALLECIWLPHSGKPSSPRLQPGKAVVKNA